MERLRPQASSPGTGKHGAGPAFGRARPPVFVVGAPESGADRLAAMLAAHPAFAEAPDTHFFDAIPPADLDAAIYDRRWPERATSLIAHLEIEGRPLLQTFDLSAVQIYRFLVERTPSISAMLDSLCVQFAHRQGKLRWVEATGDHLPFVTAIRSAYPQSPILRIVRDPRDSALAASRRNSFSPSIIANAYLWRARHDACDAFFQSDEDSFTLRHEDLVECPEEVLDAVCSFIGEDFDAAMLEAGGRTGESAARSDPLRPGAWKAWLSRDELRVCDLACAEYLDAFGYERHYSPQHTRYAYRLGRRYLERFERILASDAAIGVRWLPTQDWNAADKIVDLPASGLWPPLIGVRFARDIARDTLLAGTARLGRGASAR